MNTLLLAAQAGLEARPERIVTTFGVDWPHLLSQIVSFCIVCFILYRFAYRPVLNMLEVRRQQIAQGAERDHRLEALGDRLGKAPGEALGIPSCGTRGSTPKESMGQ